MSQSKNGHGVNLSLRSGFRLRGFRKLRMCGLITVFAALTTSACGTPHATLDFVAPSAATAGTPFTIIVNVIYQDKPDTVINNHIHFTSSDPNASLPGDYFFTPTDAGSHTFTNGFTLFTPGNQTVSGYIVDASGINGSATVSVAP